MCEIKALRSLVKMSDKADISGGLISAPDLLVISSVTANSSGNTIPTFEVVAVSTVGTGKA